MPKPSAQKRTGTLLLLVVIFAVAAGAAIFITKQTGQAIAYCTDSDGGKNYEVAGTVKAGSASYPDACITGKVLGEMFCSGNKPVRDRHTCPANCVAGACVSSSPPPATPPPTPPPPPPSPQLVHNASTSLYHNTSSTASFTHNASSSAYSPWSPTSPPPATPPPSPSSADTTPPAVSELGGGDVLRKGVLGSYAAVAKDAGGVLSCNQYVNGVNNGAITTSPSTATERNVRMAGMTFSTSVLGSHTLQVKCKDYAGNEGSSPMKTITVIDPLALPAEDTTPPETTIVDAIDATGASVPPGGAAVNFIIFKFTGADPSPGVGVAGFICGTSSQCGGYYMLTLPSGTISTATHTFATQAYDGKNQYDSTPASRTWTWAPVQPYTCTCTGSVTCSATGCGSGFAAGSACNAATGATCGDTYGSCSPGTVKGTYQTTC